MTGWRESDKGGIFGTFKGPQGSGSFAFYPSKEGSEAKKKMDEAANLQRRQTLLSMGFPDWLIEQALIETSGLEPAINWITSKLEDDHTPSGNPNSNATPDRDDSDSDAIVQLTSLGFDADAARKALTKTVRRTSIPTFFLFFKIERQRRSCCQLFI